MAVIKASLFSFSDNLLHVGGGAIVSTPGSPWPRLPDLTATIHQARGAQTPGLALVAIMTTM
jgi:hypothetical protein